MSVWKHASKTDPSATKQSKVGGYESTSVNGYWFFKKATELWGSCGKGWGYEIIEDRLDTGGPIYNKEGEQIGVTQAHTIKLHLWYESKEQFVISYGHTPFTYQSKYGITTDMEAPKKSLTDAIKKALSMLGFAADIFQGEWDDHLYVEERQREEAIEKSVDKEAEKAAQDSEYREKLDKNISTMLSAETKPEAVSIYKVILKEAMARNDQAAQKLIAKAVAQLEGKFEDDAA